MHEELHKVFQSALIADYSEAHPLIEQGLRQSTTFLSLVSLIALVIGALGVATAIQAHLQQKMDSIAVMKCLGAKSAQILRIYVLQTTGLGLAGSVAGIALGSLVHLAFRYFSRATFRSPRRRVSTRSRRCRGWPLAFSPFYCLRFRRCWEFVTSGRR